MGSGDEENVLQSPSNSEFNRQDDDKNLQKNSLPQQQQQSPEAVKYDRVHKQSPPMMPPHVSQPSIEALTPPQDLIQPIVPVQPPMTGYMHEPQNMYNPSQSYYSTGQHPMQQPGYPPWNMYHHIN